MRPTTRQFQKLHVVPDVPLDLEHAAMPDLTVHLLLDPREGHLRLGDKEGALLVSALPRRKRGYPGPTRFGGSVGAPSSLSLKARLRDS